MSRRSARTTIRLQAPWWRQDEKDEQGKLIKEGEYVKVLEVISRGVYRDMMDTMKRIKLSGKASDMADAEINLEFTQSDVEDAQIITMITEWNFLDDDGHPLSLPSEKPEVLRTDVGEEDVEYILEEIAKRNRVGTTTKEKTAFLLSLKSGS